MCGFYRKAEKDLKDFAALMKRFEPNHILELTENTRN